MMLFTRPMYPDNSVGDVFLKLPALLLLPDPLPFALVPLYMSVAPPV